MNSYTHIGEGDPEFVEVDPTGRYGRYKEILGKGASKIVYRAFDEYQGIEVAWNQIKFNDFLQSSGDLERLYCEIHLLKMLKHKNVMKYYTSWIDTTTRNINFVTEMFTSGTLKQYREKHRRVSIFAIKSWCRQILEGLLYLHSLDPPVIHRDLKCDNIFVNGNQGEVKIGDLGLAAILRKSHAAHCVGTPEFMAPEVYAEEYNELVDIYSFGMCILEMVTLEYPYNECTHTAQIYKKVISGKKPDALYKVKDPEVRHFVEKCLATVSLRLSARELLDDPFLQVDSNSDSRLFGSWRDGNQRDFLMRQPLIGLDHKGNSCSDVSFNEYSKGLNFESHREWEFDPTETGKSGIELFEYAKSGIELFEYANDELDEQLTNVGIAIKGQRRKDGVIFLRLQILDNEELLRNIYFPFDIEIDTALTVATEMVAELDIDDQDVTKIADMIDGEIASLVPEWEPGPGFEETTRFPKPSYFRRCASKNYSASPFLNLSNTSAPQSMKTSPCSGIGCAAVHGRFEEFTYQIDSPWKNASQSVNSPLFLHQAKGFDRTEIWDRQKSPESSAMGSRESCSGEESELSRTSSRKGKKEKNRRKGNASYTRSYVKAFADLCYIKAVSCFSSGFSEKLESEFQREMGWISAKYHKEVRGFSDPRLRLVPSSSPPSSPGTTEVINGISPLSMSNPFQGEIISKLFWKY